jgi:hypothetical protein
MASGPKSPLKPKFLFFGYCLTKMAFVQNEEISKKNWIQLPFQMTGNKMIICMVSRFWGFRVTRFWGIRVLIFKGELRFKGFFQVNPRNPEEKKVSRKKGFEFSGFGFRGIHISKDNLGFHGFENSCYRSFRISGLRFSRYLGFKASGFKCFEFSKLEGFVARRIQYFNISRFQSYNFSRF